MKTTVDIERLVHCWEPLENLFHIRTRDEYENAVKILNMLLDRVMDDQSHPLFGFVETLGTVIEAWEEEHESVPPVSGKEMLRFLMDQHNLRQSDLPEVGSQGVVSEILAGNRSLNLRQIQALARRFGVLKHIFL
ncbi:helix-turn-helix domain-containing protein [Leptospirillum ferrooxidans]|jgi:HTH-type transcriptional regulator/antitoxin HigA|uniref:Putative transcriptional regulator n=1 Tax=Leptospirillum ferrooxidans (strain C2-3) TaxID=1162668 RepID=I0ILU9_LEPFC|nr:transcriptional regulator [Leptospirillum ferrooxidans]BAM06248.1 putative transcriptional regulator [Leptospirillum ferrooxidans C2-3]